MRGQGDTVDLLLSKADDKNAALLTPNKDGLSTYHLALKAGNEEQAQRSALKMIGSLGELAVNSGIMLSKDVVKETPLLMAVGSHQVMMNDKGYLPPVCIVSCLVS